MTEHEYIRMAIAAACGVEDGHACPAVLVLPCLIDALLAGDKRGIVGQYEEWV